VFPGFNARLALACSGEIVPLPLRRPLASPRAVVTKRVRFWPRLATAGLLCVAQPPLIGRGQVPSAFPFPLLATPCTLPSESAVLVAARLQRLTATHGKLDRWWHKQKKTKRLSGGLAVWLSTYLDVVAARLHSAKQQTCKRKHVSLALPFRVARQLHHTNGHVWH
jgi:hypothetical protein